MPKPAGISFVPFPVTNVKPASVTSRIALWKHRNYTLVVRLFYTLSQCGLIRDSICTPSHVYVTHCSITVHASWFKQLVFSSVDMTVVNICFCQHVQLSIRCLMIANRYVLWSCRFLTHLAAWRCFSLEMIFRMDGECKVFFLCVNKPKALVAREGFHVAVSTSILVNGMVRRLKGNTGKCCDGRNATAESRCGYRFVRLLSVASV